MINPLIRLVLVTALFLTAGCSEDNFRKYESLGGLRVLALRADQGAQFSGVGEFSPGDTAVVTPYVSFYGLSGAPSFAVTACPDPGVNVGVTPSCEGATGAVTVSTGTVVLSGGASNTGQASAFSVTIPSDVLSGRSAASQYNGVNYLVVYKLTSADGLSSVSSFKRLVVSSGAKTKNQNPTLSGLLGNGVALGSIPASEIALGISYSAGSRESYSVMASDGSLQTQSEDLIATYFITDGKLKFVRTVNEQTSTYTPPSPVPTDHTPVMVAVVRDPRGGIAVVVLQ